MCGIAGILSNDHALDRQQVTQRMLNGIAHRGPDGEGMIDMPPVCLGHRRLAIIDVEGGAQPLHNETGRVTVVYNGEIYNYQELREQLIANGHRFRTNTDSEVIVHAWEQWGEHCVEHFRGMFAFALTDADRDTLFLARDHLGIKPLVYGQFDGNFVFASEIRAIENVFSEHLQLDATALAQYMQMFYIPAPRTIFRELKKLPAAHHLTLRISDGTYKIQRYWRLRPQNEPFNSTNEWYEAAEASIRNSVRAHLVSDVPFGAFLSGGIDSSLIVSLMQEELNSQVKVFTIAFEDDQFSEHIHAQQVAQHLGCEHFVEIITADVPDTFLNLIQQYGEPFADCSALPTYWVSKLARTHVPMVLSGDGGDESFCGYERYEHWWNSLAPAANYSGWKRAAAPLAKKLCPWALAPLPSPISATAEAWFQQSHSMSNVWIDRLWRPEHRVDALAMVPQVADSWQYFDFLEPERRGPACDIENYLVGDILTKVDIASMSQGLEVRTPLVDVEVMKLAISMPMTTLRHRTSGSTWQTKLPLRRMLDRRFPKGMFDRNKRGFGIPLRQWFSADTPIGKMCHEVLSDRNAAVNEFFDPRVISEMLSPVTRTPVYMLYRLFVLEQWMQRSTDNITLSATGK